MGIEVVTLLIVSGLLSLVLLGVPLGISTLMVSVVTALLAFGAPGLFLVAVDVYGVLEKYPLIAVPSFIFMAAVMERSGIAESLFDSMAVIGGDVPGNLAMQTCVVAVLFAAMSGIMGGEIVLLGMVALPQMFRLGYDRKLSIGVICAAGALATLIPPSIVMIIYGMSASVSITRLFTAGVVPGLMLASFYMAYVYIRCRRNPELAPTIEDDRSFVERLTSLKGLALPLLVIGPVLGSIYAGIASVTEAAALGAMGALVAAFVRGKLNYAMVRDALHQTTLTIGPIIWLVLGAVSLIGIYNLLGGGDFLRGLLMGMDVHPLLVVGTMMLILMVLGTFLEWIAMIFITVPIFVPIVSDLGYDPVWFGVLFAINIQIYYLSPPFGPACFFLKSVAPDDVTLHEIFAAVLPFIALQILGLIIVLLFPEVALWLPRVLED